MSLQTYNRKRNFKKTGSKVMRYLSQEDIQQISGGDISATLTVNVLTVNETAFGNALGAYITGLGDINTLTAQFAANPVTNIEVNNFTINHP